LPRVVPRIVYALSVTLIGLVGASLWFAFMSVLGWGHVDPRWRRNPDYVWVLFAIMVAMSTLGGSLVLLAASARRSRAGRSRALLLVLMVTLLVGMGVAWFVAAWTFTHVPGCDPSCER
jgi:hypothetical protein